MTNNLPPAHFHTFGCRLNQAETAMMANNLLQAGYVVQNNSRDLLATSESCWHIINSCVVTDQAVKDCQQLIRKIKREQPKAKIAVVGCYPQADNSAKDNDVQLVLGSNDKLKLAFFLNKWQKQQSTLVSINKASTKEFVSSDIAADAYKTRAMLKIQDGCDFFCSFCVVPFARGRARSRQHGDIIKEAKQLIASGYKELVITGVNIGLYSAGIGFQQLLNELLLLPQLGRLRISSIEPTTIDKNLLLAISNNPDRLANFLHLPLQSAADNVLQSMRRRYRLADFDKYINTARELLPNICLGTDIIAGYPDETKADFDLTADYLANSTLNFAHVFPFSVRASTRASQSGKFIDNSEIKRRAKILRQISSRKWNQFCNLQLGKQQVVLFEQEIAPNVWQGYSSNYIRVQARGVNLKNKLAVVELKKINNQIVEGALV